MRSRIRLVWLGKGNRLCWTAEADSKDLQIAAGTAVFVGLVSVLAADDFFRIIADSLFTFFVFSTLILATGVRFYSRKETESAERAKEEFKRRQAATSDEDDAVPNPRSRKR